VVSSGAASNQGSHKRPTSRFDVRLAERRIGAHPSSRDATFKRIARTAAWIRANSAILAIAAVGGVYLIPVRYRRKMNRR
jgi:hypothetical protein